MRNQVKLESLKILEVDDNICKLLMSEDETNFLVGWELVENHPNCMYIRAYCKGRTPQVEGLEGYFEREGKPYYDERNHTYVFGDIKIKNI